MRKYIIMWENETKPEIFQNISNYVKTLECTHIHNVTTWAQKGTKFSL